MARFIFVIMGSVQGLLSNGQLGTKSLPGQIHTTGNKSFAISKLTHFGLVTPYGARDLGQHWFR